MEEIEDDSWNDYFASKLSIQNNSSCVENNSNQYSKDCKNCGSNNESFIINSGDVVCVKCGFIQESTEVSQSFRYNR